MRSTRVLDIGRTRVDVAMHEHVLPLLLDVEVQDEVADDGKDAEEDAEDGDIGPPERLGPEAEQREDGSCGDLELYAILSLFSVQC